MAFATAHNGGRVQVNFNYPEDGGDFWALNLLKTATTVKCVDNGPIDPSQLDTDGYPTSLTGYMTSGVVYPFFRPTGTQRGGATPNRYKMTWDGNGTLSLAAHALTTIASSGVSVVGATATSAGGTGSWTVDITNDTDVLIQLRITAVSSPRITNLKFFHVDDETLINAGETFGVQFKTKLRESNFGAYRFLTWQQGNTTNVTTWNTRKPETHVNWAGSQYRADLYGGVTSFSGFTFTASAPSLNSSTNAAWSGLVDKCLVTVALGQQYTGVSISGVTFTNGSANITIPGHALSVGYPVVFESDGGSLPAEFSRFTHVFVKTVVGDVVTVAATSGGTAIVSSGAGSGTLYAHPVLMLNVGGTGPLPIRGAAAYYLSSNDNNYPNLAVPDRSGICTLMYDAGLQSWIKKGGCTSEGAVGIFNVVPVEVMFRLCAEMGAHPMWVANAEALDPITDYYPSLAAYNLANAPSWMCPVYEPPNELWNPSGGFNSTGYANNKVQTFGWSAPNYQDFYGKIASVYGQAIATVYSVAKADVKTNQTKYKFGIGCQTAALGASPERFDASKYVAQAAAGQSGAVAYNYGTYAKDASKDWATHLITAQYWNTGLQDFTAAEDTMAAAFVGGDTSQAQIYLDSSDDNIATFDIPGLNTINLAWKAFAITKGITKHLGYEGGYYPSFRTANVQAMQIAAKLLPNMKTFTKLNINNFFALSEPGVYTAEFPSQFQFSGQVRAGIVDEWSMYDDVYETAKPMAQAFQELNQTAKFINLRMRIHG